MSCADFVASKCRKSHDMDLNPGGLRKVERLFANFSFLANHAFLYKLKTADLQLKSLIFTKE